MSFPKFCVDSRDHKDYRASPYSAHVSAFNSFIRLERVSDICIYTRRIVIVVSFPGSFSVAGIKPRSLGFRERDDNFQRAIRAKKKK